MYMMRRLTPLMLILVATSLLQGQSVKTGIDNLVDTDFALLSNKRIVLVTHSAARSNTGRTTAEEFQRTARLTLLRILTPEHGFYGIVRAGVHVQDSSYNGTPMLSLYGANRKPTDRHLADADVVVVDMQDIGSRSYTYISTMTEVMDACAERGLPVVILDRPNPLGGLAVDGSVPDPGFQNFICRLPIPYIHGLTMGELAGMINGMGWLSAGTNGKARTCSLTVVKLKRWSRDMPWEFSDLSWYPTSPNIPSIEAARMYPVTGLLGELGGLSIGIGTTIPFLVVGSPSFTGSPFIIQRMQNHGIRAVWQQFMPYTGSYANTPCHGYFFSYMPGSVHRPFTAGMALICALRDAGLLTITVDAKSMFAKACGTVDYMQLLASGAPWSQIEKRCDKGVVQFRHDRTPYLLY